MKHYAPFSSNWTSMILHNTIFKEQLENIWHYVRGVFRTLPNICDEVFAKIVSGWKLLNILAKKYIINIWECPKHASERKKKSVNNVNKHTSIAKTLGLGDRKSASRKIAPPPPPRRFLPNRFSPGLGFGLGAILRGQIFRGQSS